MKTLFGAERVIDAPAAVVYHCLADYLSTTGRLLSTARVRATRDRY